MVKRTVYMWFGILVNEPKKGLEVQQLSTFLSSSLNIELVYVILTGITRFSSSHKCLHDAVHSIEKQGDDSGEKKGPKISPYEQVRHLQLNKIKINNATQWDIAKQEDFVAKGAEKYNSSPNSFTSKSPIFVEKEQILSEEIMISDIAHSIF